MEVVAELVKRLCDEHPPVRRSALLCLTELVPRCDVAVALLLFRSTTANAQGSRDAQRSRN